MPKLVYNKALIQKAYHNRHNTNLTVAQIAEIFNISRKSVYNYVNSPTLTDNIDDSNYNKRNKRSFSNFISEIIEFIKSKTINNRDFNFKSLRKKIKKEFKVNIKKGQLYSILSNEGITYKRANCKNTTVKAKRSLSEIKDLHTKITSINNGELEDNINFTDEVHISLDSIKRYGWNKSGEEVTFDKQVPSELVNKRISMIVTINKSGKVNYTITKGTCNADLYKKHIKKTNKICPKKYYYQDGAKIHSAKIVKNSMKRLGIIPITGVPYTPELNIAEYFLIFLNKK